MSIIVLIIAVLGFVFLVGYTLGVKTQKKFTDEWYGYYQEMKKKKGFNKCNNDNRF